MFAAILNRTHAIEDWQKIPWNDPDFSRRMLKEHLTQAHDAASRRTPIIQRQVAWIDRQVLCGTPARILDLGCGPGLYTAQFAACGHLCTGIDYSPASIEYARQQSNCCTYIQGDVRDVEFGAGYELAMMIFGELNTFTPEDAQRIVDKAYASLKPGGQLLLEPHTYQGVECVGRTPPTWYSAEAGLFSDQPYLCLQESYFEAPCAVTRHYVIDAQSGQMTIYGSTLRAYTEAEYRHLLRAFRTVEFYPALIGEPDDDSLCAILARK